MLAAGVLKDSPASCVHIDGMALPPRLAAPLHLPTTRLTGL